MLIPSVSDYSTRVLSHQYDIAPYLTNGENVLAFWLAPGWSALEFPKGGFNITKAPLVMAQLTMADMATEAQPKVLLTTTADWKGANSNIEHIGQWQWGNYGGEYLNHSADKPGWNTNASMEGWADCSCFDVDRQVTPESLQAVTSVETVRATAVAPCSDSAVGCYVVSFPHLFNGFLDISSLPASAGNVTTFTYSANCKAPCGPLKPYMPCNPPSSGAGACTSVSVEWNAIDKMSTAAGSDRSSFHNRFNW
jgi:hypothetical protein